MQVPGTHRALKPATANTNDQLPALRMQERQTREVWRAARNVFLKVLEVHEE